MSPSRLLGLAFASLVPCVATGGATEQESYQVRGVAGLPEQTLLAMAGASKPSWHTVPQYGATLREMLRSTCGSQTSRVTAALEALTVKLNGGGSIERLVEGGVAVAIPFCLKVERDVSVVVEEGDTLESLLRQHYGFAGALTLKQTFELNNDERRWSTVEQFSRSLQPKQHVVLPYVAYKAIFTQADSVTDFGVTGEPKAIASPPPTLDQIIDSTPEPKAALLAANVESTPPPPPERPPYQFRYVRFVSSAADAKKWCSESATDPPPFEMATLKARFQIEARFAAAYAGYIPPPTIGIVDTGIGGVNKGVFAERFMHANYRELYGQKGEDDDQPQNGFIDDVYGINFNQGPENGSIVHYAGDPDFDHGTKVGTIVLGGSAWATAWDAQAAPWARLKIINFSSAKDGHPVDADKLVGAISYLLKQDTRVVNLSLENYQAIDGLSQIIGDTTRTLFVAAAGNTDAGGVDLALHPAYPACYGGETGKLASVVLTVGAHARNRSFAGFSNYSPKFVDVLAPGCAVETQAADGNVVKESGTSIATAFASFAAGLVGALGETDGRAIKNRLLVSVDVDDQLQKQVRLAGRLNIIKAVSLSSDVIELRDGTKPYWFGHLEDRDQLRTFCKEEGLKLELNRMRKVRPNVSTPQGLRIQYWVENDGVLSVVECTQEATDQPIGTIDTDGAKVPGPTLAEVRDIVLADRSM